MERERECQNSVRERQLCSGDVGFVTWRTSSYGIKLIVGLRCGEKGWESLGGLYRKGGRFVIRKRDGEEA